MTENLNNQRDIITSKIRMGMDLVDRKQYSESLSYFQLAWEVCSALDKELRDPLTAMAAIGIGTANHGNGDCVKALEWYNIGLSIRQYLYKEEIRMDMAYLYRTIAMCNYDIGKYWESLGNFYKQRDMFEALEKKGYISSDDTIEVYHNIGVCYERLNINERSLENYQIVLNKREQFYKAKYHTELPINHDSADYQLIDEYADALRDVGAAYYRLGSDYHKSASFFQQALQLRESIYKEEPQQGIVNLYKDLALTYQNLQDTTNSIIFSIKRFDAELKLIKSAAQEDYASKIIILNDLLDVCNKLEQNLQDTINDKQVQLSCKAAIHDNIEIIRSTSKLNELYKNLNYENENMNFIIQSDSFEKKTNTEIVQNGLDIMEEIQMPFVGE